MRTLTVLLIASLVFPWEALAQTSQISRSADRPLFAAAPSIQIATFNSGFAAATRTTLQSSSSARRSTRRPMWIGLIAGAGLGIWVADRVENSVCEAGCQGVYLVFPAMGGGVGAGIGWLISRR